MVKSGFFESVDHDRVYDSNDFCSIFDPILTDGILIDYKDGLKIELPKTVSEGILQVNIKTGVAWFKNHFISLNTDEIVELDSSPSYNQRWDAVVIDCDLREETREYSLKYIKGTVLPEEIDRTTGSEIRSMFLPELANTEDHFQIPLCYIMVYRNVSAITEKDIVNMIGRQESDYITYERNGITYRLKTKKNDGTIINTPGCPTCKLKENEDGIYGPYNNIYKYIYFIYDEPSEEDMKLLKLNTETDEMIIIDSDDPKYIDISMNTIFMVLEEM